MNALPTRQPHAVLDIPSRFIKAQKIEALLKLERTQEQQKLLEIGTGSGGIAHYFANYSQHNLKVYAVDIADMRQSTGDYDFQLIKGTSLPYPDATFDIIITNHVIEHVGTYFDQIAHLREIYRTLKPNGKAYLAVPNRWMLVEPHYQLAFLSWLPKKWRSPYLKFMRNVAFYDCEPLEMKELETMLSTSHFQYKNVCIDAMQLMQTLENSPSLALKICNHLPPLLLQQLIRLIPTLIYVLEKPKE